jgi:hypothetical protein
MMFINRMLQLDCRWRGSDATQTSGVYTTQLDGARIPALILAERPVGNGLENTIHSRHATHHVGTTAGH